MEAIVRYVDKMTFLGRGASNHWVPIDTSSLNGTGAGSSPMELLLMSIAGCSGMDVVSILGKKRVQFDSMEIRLNGERSEEHPRRFTNIVVEFIFTGNDLPPKPFEDAVRLSMEKYCSVVGTINESTNVAHKVTLLSEAEGEE